MAVQELNKDSVFWEEDCILGAIGTSGFLGY